MEIQPLFSSSVSCFRKLSSRVTNERRSMRCDQIHLKRNQIFNLIWFFDTKTDNGTLVQATFDFE